MTAIGEIVSAMKKVVYGEFMGRECLSALHMKNVETVWHSSARVRGSEEQRICSNQIRKIMLNLCRTSKFYPATISVALSTGAFANSPITFKDELLNNHSVTPPVTPWPKKIHPSLLVSMINRQKRLDIAIQVFEYAGKFHPGFNHNYQTFGALITRLARGRHFDKAETLLSEMQNSGIKCSEEGMFIALIRNYGLTHRPKDAFRTFSRMVDFGAKRTYRSLNCLLAVLVMNKEYDWVHLLFKSYKRKFGLMPDVITCNILVKGLCRKGDMKGALEVVDEMPGMGVVPNLVTYTTLIFGYVECGDLKGAKSVFVDILDKGLKPDVMTYTTMIKGYCNDGRLGDAVKVMDEMEEAGIKPNSVTYSLMIEAYCKERKAGEAANLLIDMLNHNHFPSSTLCCKVIDGLCQAEKVEVACVVWKKLLNKNVSLDSAISCTLIHWLCKKVDIWEAKKVFNELQKVTTPNTFTYNALIAGMCEAGELAQAVRLRDDMLEKKCIPNCFTYDILIKGLCEADNSKEGMRLLEEMVVNSSLPNESTYSMLIDRLASSGLVAEMDSLLSVIANKGGRIDSKSWEVILTKVAGSLEVTSMLDCIILDDARSLDVTSTSLSSTET